MHKTKLYIDIDGVLITKKQTKPADDVHNFINYCIKKFDCYWLTTHCKGDNKGLLRYLGQYFNDELLEQLKLIKNTNWETLKTEAIDFKSKFIWLDDSPFNAEINTLKQYNVFDSLVIVNLDHKDQLKKVIRILHKKITPPKV